MLAVAVNTVVDGALVVLLEYLNMEDILANEYLVGYLGDFKLTILIEDDDVIEVGAVAYEFIFLQPCTNESFLTVDVEFLVSLYHLSHLNGIEVSDFCFARMVLSILALEIFKPVDGNIGHVSQVILNLSKFSLNLHQQFVCLILIIFKDSLHLDFQEFENVLAGNFPMEGILYHTLTVYFGSKEFVLEWLEFRIDEGNNFILTLTLLKLSLLVDTFFDENPFERREEELLLQFTLSDHQFLAQQSHCAVYAVAQHIADGEENRLVVFDDAAVGRDVDFAIAESVECIHRFI